MTRPKSSNPRTRIQQCSGKQTETTTPRGSVRGSARGSLAPEVNVPNSLSMRAVVDAGKTGAWRFQCAYRWCRFRPMAGG